MSVGHATDSTPAVTHEQDWVKAFLALPIENAPGSTFVYDSAATYMLSAILQKVTGERVVDYLKPRFFNPLGLPAMPWQTCPRGINTGGWGLSATTDTLAKFGQFYLQRGQWQGRQLLPAVWIDEATSFKIQQPAPPGQDLEHVKQISDWHQGYCYQFWRCRHDVYRGDGAFGQYMIVLPKLDAVIAITSRTLDMQGLINIVWDTLLPELEHGASSKATAQTDGLSLKMPDGATTSPRQSKKYAFVIDDNSLGIKKLSVAFDKNDCTLAFDTHTITAGIARWHDNSTDLPGTPPEWIELVGNSRNAPGPVKLAAAGAWKDADTFVMDWRYYETPHFDTVTLHFAGDAIEVTFLNSLTQMAGAMHPETRPVLKGKARV
jgi:Beta-lactamase